MLKKFVISLLLVMIIACGMGISSTIAYAADGEVTEETNIAVNYKVACFKIEGSYTANTPIEFKDGDAVVGTLKIDKNSANTGFGVKLPTGSTFSFVPNANYKVTKLIYATTNNSNVVFNTPDAKYGTRFNDLTDADVALLSQAGISANKTASFGAELNVNHTATEEDPYKFTISMALELGTICVVYEETGTYTRTHDCTSDKPTNTNATVKVGDATFPIKYEGTFNKGYPAYGDGSFRITINPVPGYVINYVIFTSPLDNPFDEKELKYPGLEATYENGNLTVTGMQVGQTYTVYSDGGAVGLLTSITVNYQKHEHSGVYEPGSDETHHFKQCECLWRVDEEEHDFDEGTITVEPTHQRKGTIKYTCLTCSHAKEEKVAPNLADTEITSEDLIYNGSTQFANYTVKYKGQTLASWGSYYKAISGNTSAKEPGTYTFTIGPKPDSIFEGEKEVTFTIEKGNYDMSKVIFEDLEVTYNGSQFSIEATNLPNDVTVEYENNIGTNAGTYNAVAKFTLTKDDAQYYNPIDNLTATLTINKATYNMDGVVFADKTVTYNGSAFSIEATNLPNGVTVTYENNGKTDAGIYTVTAKFTGNANYNAIADKTATLTIEQAVVTAPVADGSAFIYNGQAQTYTLQENSLYTISDTTFTDAGNHTITVSLVDKTNYKWNNGNSNDLTYSFVIGKATYDMSGVVFEDKTVTYNGTAFSIEATNLPTGVTVSYENNGKTDVGVYTVTATFTGNANYNAIAPKTATLTIEKATYDMSGVVFANRTVTYNGTAFSIEATNLPTGVTVSYENNGKTDVGEYTITAIFTGNANYNAIANKTATLTINKATYDMSGVVFADKTVTYDGNAFSIEATNLPSGVTVAYENNGKTDVGEYTITAIFTGNANYNAIANKTATLTINKATYDMSGVVFANKTVTYNGNAFSIDATNLPTGVTASYENNGKTEAGVYTIIAKFTGNGNYNEIPNKTATLTINKAVVTAPTADTTVFTYNGQAQTYALQANNLYTISTATYTNAGAYPITVELNDKANYEWADGTIADLTFSFVIGKATYDMSGVVFEDKTVVYNGNEFTIVATNIPTGVSVTYENNVGTTAGVYTAIAKFTGDANNYNLIANKTAVLTINKATYDMSAVVFEDKTVVYNGNEFSIVATNLPNGVSATYENNGQAIVGEYTITAKFTGDADNYELIANKTAVLTIKTATLVFDTNADDDFESDIIVSAKDGIDPNKELVVKLIESDKTTEDYKEFIDKNQKVAVAYDVKLLKDGAIVQPDGSLQFKILIPMELVGKNFSILHIHNETEKSVIEYQIDGDYVVFETDKLSDFVFVYDMGSLLWVIIVLGVVALLEIAFLVFLFIKNKSFKSAKLASVYPPFIFGMFIPKSQLVLIIVLAVIVIALAVVAILFALKVINGKAKVLVANNGTALGESEEELAITEDDKEEKFNINTKSFTEKLSQSSPEVIKYYNEIRNELLSYKKVKSKISYKHESFRLGMPIVAKLKIRGKSLYLFLALDPNDYKDTKYKIKDVSGVGNSKDVPTMYKINIPRRAVYAKELIADVMNKYGVEKI